MSDDAHRQADKLTGWQQQYDQVGTGRFHGRIDELVLGELQVFNEYSNHTLYQQCLVRPDAFWFGLPSKSEGCRINGQALAVTDVFCRPGNQAFELVTPDDFNMLGVVIGKHELRYELRDHDTDLETLANSGHARLTLPDPVRAHAKYLITRIVNAQPQQLEGRIHHDLLMMTLFEILKTEQPNDTVAPSYSHRKIVVNRIREYLQEAQDAPVTVSELCDVGCVSRRTLQYSFETILGISPSQFLRVNRLNRVKRMLSLPDTTSVSAAAAFYGFYHLSQFSLDYKQLFGELPSATLNRYIKEQCAER